MGHPASQFCLPEVHGRSRSILCTPWGSVDGVALTQVNSAPLHPWGTSGQATLMQIEPLPCGGHEVHARQLRRQVIDLGWVLLEARRATAATSRHGGCWCKATGSHIAQEILPPSEHVAPDDAPLNMVSRGNH